jgi:2-polyprenyl-3-methyl-5-hydroxy-6-metoxy-1,4-benzoquinol methylase
LEELYKEYVISFFDKTLQLHGDRPAGVGASQKGQELRFEELLSIGDISGKRVLDYGCGKGDLYQFLKDKNIPVSYTGFDINHNLISLAKSKFPEAEFHVFDIEEEKLNEDFDYIFLCGVFNLKVAGIDKTIRNVLKRLFEHCNIALSFNALSAHSLNKDFQLHYVSTEAIREFAIKELSPHAFIKEGGNADDFTMFVYKKECDFCE